MKLKLIVIAIITIIGVSLHSAFAQTVSFDQTTTYIRTFENQKYYSATTTGPILGLILIGLTQNNTSILGNKHDLVADLQYKKFCLQVANASNPVDADTLSLLYYTRQVGLSPSLTEKALRKAVGLDGSVIKAWVARSWEKNEVGNTFIDVLEQFSPQINKEMIDLISQPYFKTKKDSVYKNTLVTDASESLFEVYYNVRLIELAKRSVVVKLLATYGYINIPRSVSAEFRISHAPNIVILLDDVSWDEYDVEGLIHLVESKNPYYGEAALLQLQMMSL